MADIQHITWLLEGVESWNERRRNVPDEGHPFEPDFEGAPLHRMFQEANKLDGLMRVPLAGANLVEANFAKADLTLADLSGANLWRADLTNTKLQFADLTGANLTASEPWRASLYGSAIRSPEQHPDRARPVTSIKDLLPKIQRIKEHYDPTVFLYFRGESECGWELRPSLMRSDLAVYENEMLTDLVSKRPEEFNEMTSALAQWVLAQHHGLKTRFLDVTRNPLVALYHACDKTGQREQEEGDGRLHVFAVPTALIEPFNSDAISIASNVARLSRREKDALLGKRFSLGNNRIRYEDEYVRAMRRLHRLIRQEKPYFEERIDPRHFYQVFVVEPQQASERLRAQAGAFLVSAFHERFEREEILRWNDEIPVYAHYKLTISGKHMDRIKEDLHLLNVARETLFPGLDSSARSVSDTYSDFLGFDKKGRL